MMANTNDAGKLAKAISAERLWQRHMDMGRIGGTPKGGVNRQALSAEDASAQKTLAAWAGARGFVCYRDEIGNVYVRREGTDPGAQPVLAGSHLDSQPTGGKFDGAYGVLAGFEVLEALEDAGVRTRRPVEAVAWMNEEGSRFSPGAMGSGVLAGAMALAATLERRDAEGVSVGDALAQVIASAPLPFRAIAQIRPAAYLEAHIEQGPRLEAEDRTIGVVSGIQGMRRFFVDLLGEEAHAGTTPRRNRKDAVSAAVSVIAALEELTADAQDTVRFTVGRMDVMPNSPNTVPGKVRFSIDLRHPDEGLLVSLGERIPQVVREAAARRACSAETTQVSAVAPTIFASHMVDLVRECADAEGLSHLQLPSGAGHDAMYLNRVCPSGMVFVPCLRGVSHNEAESATASDLAAGARVLARAMLEMANR